ncbi:MAG: hypothetical protein ACREUZ_12260, partial [Burkholderiales bacterium]
LNSVGPRPLWVVVFTLLLVVVVPRIEARPDEESSSVIRELQASDEPLTRYRAFRRMHARSDRFNHEGWLSAWTELDERGFRYEIVEERGSDYVRTKVLKAVLKREQELVAEGPARAALTEDNYVFTEADGPDDGLRYVLMKPKRKDVVLVDGRMVLSPDGTDLVRIEGRLAKNPSFWTSRVNIVRHFANVDGVRVPVSTESIAKVRFAGESQLEVSYEYESINGRPVTIAARRVLAAVRSR